MTNKSSVLVFAGLVLLCSLLHAQQPQTRDNPIGQQLQGINAKWVNGVGPGYWPTWTSGLTVSISAGTCFDSSDARHAYAGGTISVTNATNYVDLKDSDCSVEISTSAYQSRKHIASIVASAGAVTSITDDRGWLVTPTVGVTTTGSPSSPKFTCFSGSTSITNCTIPRGIVFDIACSAGLVTTSLDLCATSSYVTVPFGCTISAYNLAIDAGTITVKFWKIATGTAIPTSANSISTSGVAIASGTAIHSTTTSDFTTTTVTANDIMAMAVTAVSTAKEVTGVLTCDESQ